MKTKSKLMAINLLVCAWILLPGLMIFLNIQFKLPEFRNIILQIIGALMVIGAFIMTEYIKAIFKKIGKGTPVPIEPPTEFVKVGVFKYSRNPMYIAYLVSWLGMYFIFGHILLLAYFFLQIFLWNLLVVKLEEPELKVRFGEPYIQYTKEVPRWFLFK